MLSNCAAEKEGFDSREKSRKSRVGKLKLQLPYLILSLHSMFPQPTPVPRTKQTENEKDRKTKPNQQASALWHQGSLDDEILDGHGNEDGGEGEQGDDEEGELLVCEAASRLLALGSFRPCVAG